jgi:hypothetical protein
MGGFQTKQTEDTDRRSIYWGNVGEVYKTSYKKGKIKEFQKLSENPLKVAPLVKVEVDGETSDDFVPIFYKPKEGYWDTDDHAAQDFNEDGDYYENAWMSFRGDDEVIVQFYGDDPVAVIGFADGLPRLGEDVVYVTGESIMTQIEEEIRQRMSNLQEYTDGDVGPDGKPLSLKLECELILKESGIWRQTVDPPPMGQGCWFVSSTDTDYIITLHPYDDTIPLVGVPGGSIESVGYTSTYAVTQTSHYKCIRYRRKREGLTYQYLVKIGPLLFCFQFLNIVEYKAEKVVFTDSAVSTRTEGGPGINLSTREIGLGGAVAEWHNTQDNIDAFWANAVDKHIHTEEDDPEESPCRRADYGGKTLDHCTKWEDEEPIRVLFAGIYTKELYDRIKGEAAVNHPSVEFVRLDPEPRNRDEFPKEYADTFKQDSLGAAFEKIEFIDPGRTWTREWEDCMDFGTLKFYVRPHTKEEIEQYIGAKSSS